mmetsp:Transcript_6619/g.18531  ORF Transcript_6619/g.18531 Transcript_6619/m.18531 type:complete len:387 (-) Transcript_6619:366-1526(-)
MHVPGLYLEGMDMGRPRAHGHHGQEAAAGPYVGHYLAWLHNHLDGGLVRLASLHVVEHPPVVEVDLLRGGQRRGGVEQVRDPQVEPVGLRYLDVQLQAGGGDGLLQEEDDLAAGRRRGEVDDRVLGVLVVLVYGVPVLRPAGHGVHPLAAAEVEALGLDHLDVHRPQGERRDGLRRRQYLGPQLVEVQRYRYLPYHGPQREVEAVVLVDAAQEVGRDGRAHHRQYVRDDVRGVVPGPLRDRVDAPEGVHRHQRGAQHEVEAAAVQALEQRPLVPHEQHLVELPGRQHGAHRVAAHVHVRVHLVVGQHEPAELGVLRQALPDGDVHLRPPARREHGQQAADVAAVRVALLVGRAVLAERQDEEPLDRHGLREKVQPRPHVLLAPDEG